MLQIKELCMEHIEEIKTFFVGIFTDEPWNDDWSDPVQLHAYMIDLIGNRNSFVLGLFENEAMIGLSIGSIKHWYSGTEYYIDELCIKKEKQGHGLGTRFLKEIETFIKQKGMNQIFLQTKRTIPAYDFYKKNGYFELEDYVSMVRKLES
ncbi:MAG TPA: GNAT family N-acetyltransferase [Lachnospiraceae bacterium]|nr:GNAT family N-acetyltransferase [Lachnospiraceae bacterium]